MDVVVVGGGIVGLSSAHALAAAGADVTLCESDSLGAGSTARSAGGIRTQFSTPVNVRLSIESLRVWEAFEAIRRDAGSPPHPRRNDARTDHRGGLFGPRVQHAPATGRVAAEPCIDGEASPVDVEALSSRRFDDEGNEPVEGNVA
jgi:2-polyprenyl-6-methoxyphenol hydroxylase-like FAD-dependent oxidoreductase